MATTVSKLTTKIVDDLFSTYPNLFTGSTRSLYINAIQSVFSNLMSKDIELNKVEPDYERIMLQLIQAVGEDPEWYDMLVAGTGHALLRMIASGITYDQFSIQRAFQETFMFTASSDNSIYAATRMLGIRPRRKIPSRVTAQLTRDSPDNYYEIAPYTGFYVGDYLFFNRDKIVFGDAVTQLSSFLYQGNVIEETITSNGEPFQRFTLGNGTYSASDSDIQVTVDDVVWERSTDGPWTIEKNAKKYYESTTASGDIEIEFGNGDFGYIPSSSSIIKIRWVETLGLEGNFTTANSVITMLTASSAQTKITGTCSTNSEGGDDQLSPSVYRKIAPNLHAAQRRAVRRSDYIDLAMEFADVKDAMFRGQAELAPGRRSMQNVIGVTLLTETTWASNRFEAFATEFNEKLGIYKLEFLRIDPIPVVVDITADVYCRPDAALSDVKSELTLALTELFAPKKNHLGYNIYLTDISDILNGRRKDQPSEKLEQDVEYCIIDPSVVDTILPDKKYYAKLGTVVLNMKYTTRGGYSGRLDLTPTGVTI